MADFLYTTSGIIPVRQFRLKLLRNPFVVVLRPLAQHTAFEQQSLGRAFPELLVNGYRVGKLVAILKAVAFQTLPVCVLLVKPCRFKPTGNHVSAVKLTDKFSTGDALADPFMRVPLPDVLREVPVGFGFRKGFVTASHP